MTASSLVVEGHSVYNLGEITVAEGMLTRASLLFVHAGKLLRAASLSCEGFSVLDLSKSLECADIRLATSASVLGTSGCASHSGLLVELGKANSGVSFPTVHTSLPSFSLHTT